MANEFDNAVEAGSGSGTTWDANEQKVIFGTYKHSKSNVGPNDSMVYIVKEDDKDEDTSIWGSTVLDTKFADVPLGSRVQVTYLGKTDGKRGQYKDYKVVFIAPKSDIAAKIEEVFPGAEQV